MLAWPYHGNWNWIVGSCFLFLQEWLPACLFSREVSAMSGASAQTNSQEASRALWASGLEAHSVCLIADPAAWSYNRVQPGGLTILSQNARSLSSLEVSHHNTPYQPWPFLRFWQMFQKIPLTWHDDKTPVESPDSQPKRQWCFPTVEVPFTIRYGLGTSNIPWSGLKSKFILGGKFFEIHVWIFKYTFFMDLCRPSHMDRLKYNKEAK